MRSRAILITGALLMLAPSAWAQNSASGDDVSQEGARFARVYAALEQNYMDRVEPDQAILESGVRGMLAALDPFSSFFNSDQFKTLQEQARGQALGFGSILFVQPGKIVVLETAQGSPSWRAGLGPGDEIVSVNGTRIIDLEFRSLVELLQRSRSQPVTLGVIHAGKHVPVDIKLVPAEVALPTVDKSFLLDSGIAYLHVSGFEGKTPQEVADAVGRLTEKEELKGILLDLRDNHGGIVDSAAATASLFLKPNQVMLTVRGRAAPERIQRTFPMPAHFDAPMIVLVNQDTASAAEIFAAALEEHDRALVVGQTTFGKGLVQSVMPLSEQCGLALTTAQYFTSSGRSIQRPLPGTALAAEVEPMSAPSAVPLGAIRPAAPVAGAATPFHTDVGRPVLAGGGIVPDVLIPDRPLDPWVAFVNQRGFLTSYASDYLTLHGKVSPSFETDEITLDDFRDFLTRQGIRSPEQYWTRDADYLRFRIKAEIFDLVFGLAAGDEVEVKGDPQVERARTLFDKIPFYLKAPRLKTGMASAEIAK